MMTGRRMAGRVAHGRLRRGFTLIEALTVCSVLGILAGILFAAVNTRSVAAAGTKGLALEVAQELRTARQLAVSQGVPHAVVFPSQGGTTAVSQSLSVWAGLPEPRFVRGTQYQGSFPSSCVAVGTWPLDTAKLSDPSAVTTIDRPNGGSVPFPCAQWLDPLASQDYWLVFAPDGSVWSNDLPLYDGRYHVLVGSGPAFSAAGPPPGTATMATEPAYFELTAVAQPQTISISLAGEVTVDPSIPAVGSGVALKDSSTGDAVASAQTGGGAGNQAPVLQELSVLPSPVDGTVPPGLDALVPKGGYLSLQVLATDPDGDRVDCSWSATGTKPDVGVFSAPPGRVPCEWDPEKKAWRTLWEWRPPTTAEPGDVFQLSCTLSDEHGASVVLSGAGGLNLEIRQGSKLMVSATDQERSDVGYDLWVMDVEGNGERNLTLHAGDDTDGQFSWDGARIVFCSDRDTPGTTELYTMNSDGSNVKRLTNDAVPQKDPDFNPQGNRIVYCQDDDGPGPGPARVLLMNSDGSNVQPVGAVQGRNPKFSPDGLHLVYEGLDGDCHIINLDGSPVKSIVMPMDQARPRYSPDGTEIVMDSNVGGRRVIYSYNVASEASTLIVDVAGQSATGPCVAGGGKLYWVEHQRVHGTGYTSGVPVGGGTDLGGVRMDKVTGSVSWAP